MNNEEIEAIRERAKKATEGNPLKDVNVLARMDRVILEDIPKLLTEIDRLRRGIEITIKETHCDDTWDYLNRLIDGKAFTELSYRIGGDNE